MRATRSSIFPGGSRPPRFLFQFRAWLFLRLEDGNQAEGARRSLVVEVAVDSHKEVALSAESRTAAALTANPVALDGFLHLEVVLLQLHEVEGQAVNAQTRADV